MSLATSFRCVALDEDHAGATRVYKPVQTTLSSAPAVEYYRKAKENQSRETLDGGRPASLLGNWQTEGQKRAIHIEQCGLFVCGYVADSSNKEKVLIDLKPTSSSEWIGLIVSAESGTMYPSVVIQKRFACELVRWA
jgi:uncharacterized protein (DUF2147 family)